MRGRAAWIKTAKLQLDVVTTTRGPTRKKRHENYIAYTWKEDEEKRNLRDQVFLRSASVELTERARV